MNRTVMGCKQRDGLIHTFDAQASGTVYSSGLGMVLLKRARDAQVQGITSLPSSREAPSTMMAVRAVVIPCRVLMVRKL